MPVEINSVICAKHIIIISSNGDLSQRPLSDNLSDVTLGVRIPSQQTIYLHALYTWFSVYRTLAQFSGCHTLCCLAGPSVLHFTLDTVGKSPILAHH